MLAMQDDLVNMQVAPARERGLKYEAKLHLHNSFIVAPARERGLKYFRRVGNGAGGCRSRKGAWIEIDYRSQKKALERVAPARERGLKSR